MSDDWILDVLADLKSFAELNKLPRLAAHLEDSHRIAASELESKRGTGPPADGTNRSRNGIGLSLRRLLGGPGGFDS